MGIEVNLASSSEGFLESDVRRLSRWYLIKNEIGRRPDRHVPLSPAARAICTPVRPLAATLAIFGSQPAGPARRVLQRVLLDFGADSVKADRSEIRQRPATHALISLRPPVSLPGER
jgi:hypothetical protein